MSNTFADKTFASLKSIAKIALQSRHGAAIKQRNARSLIVMGNGPSLSTTIAEQCAALRENDTMAVNFAPLSPEFFEIKPKYHVLADPHFFSHPEAGSNLAGLHEAFKRIDWPMTLFVPGNVDATAYRQTGISIRRFNAVGVEGFRSLTHFAYRHGLGMPRPRNVLIPAIMLAIAEGYGHIFIAGADHSWMHTISVNDDNEVVSIQRHFYPDTAKEETRVLHEYRGYHLHQIVESFAIAFKSYHDIAEYAASVGVKIVNITPGSFIDAFPRGTL